MANLRKFMSQPEVFEVKGTDDRVCRLTKSLYRLKQASGQWFLKFDEAIIFFGFKKKNVDGSLAVSSLFWYIR